MEPDNTLNKFIETKNNAKKIFTAGPASLALENVAGLEPCFGRGDDDYNQIEGRVLSNLKKLSGHRHIARLQGSGSMGLEVMISNLAFGKILVIDTGYYAQRAKMVADSASKAYGQIKKVKAVHWQDYKKVTGQYDWVFACYTETSIGLRLDIKQLRAFADTLDAKLMLDATASIGLEVNHELADAMSYSSCKGLFGLTGAAFVVFNEMPNFEIPSFNLSINSHLGKKMTGPYHAICSMDKILKDHENFKMAVKICKENFMNKFDDNLYFPRDMQPLLCTRIRGTIMAEDPKAVLYSPRTLEPNESVVCHLGEVHLGREARGAINECLSLTEVKTYDY
jgi:aspartate aminotransferase-like enzyme